MNFSMLSNINCHMNPSYNEKILDQTCFRTKIFDPNIKLYEKFEEESIFNSPPGSPIPEAVKSAAPRLCVYKCQQAFSAMAAIKSESGTNLKCLEKETRVSVSTIQPRLERLFAQKQCQPSDWFSIFVVVFLATAE